MTPADVERFHKLCGLLGSEHDGERAVAALKATEWLRERGLTWANVTVLGAVEEVDEIELQRRRNEAVKETFRQNRERGKAQHGFRSAWEFYEDLSESIRRATGGEDGQRDPRMRRGG